MTNDTKHPVLQFLTKAALAGNDQVGDDQLLERFLHQRDEMAFAVLVHRHGPMVMGVCRRVLHHSQDAEDAFQATFLVLVRKAGSIMHKEKVGHWLYGVAHRTALEARTLREKRKVKEAQTPSRQDSGSEMENRSDLQQELDRELSKLPEKYRLPILLCDLQGKTQGEAGKELGLPEGTVSGRLFRGRQMLAKRLKQQGVAVTAASLPVLLAQQSWAASVPTSVLATTVTAASAFLSASGLTSSVTSTQVQQLVEGVLRAMWMKRMRTVLVSTLILGIAITLACTLAMELFANNLCNRVKQAKVQPSPQSPAQPGQKPLSADQAFQQMERKLKAAKTLQCSLKMRMELKGEKLTEVKGKLQSKVGNLIRLEMVFERGGGIQLERMLMVSNGKLTKAGTGDRFATKKTDENILDFVVASLTRPGLFIPLFSVQNDKLGKNSKKLNPDEIFKVSNIRYGKDEKLGKKTAKVLRYNCEVVPVKTNTKVKVWLDPKTHLPLKRVIQSTDSRIPDAKSQMVVVTEQYSDWVVNGPIAAKQFQVTK